MLIRSVQGIPTLRLTGAAVRTPKNGLFRAVKNISVTQVLVASRSGDGTIDFSWDHS
jgi:hypothetical protein